MASILRDYRSGTATGKCGGPRFAKINGTYNTRRTLARTNGRCKQLYGSREEASARREMKIHARRRVISQQKWSREIWRAFRWSTRGEGRGVQWKSPAKIKTAVCAVMKLRALWKIGSSSIGVALVASRFAGSMGYTGNGDVRWTIEKLDRNDHGRHRINESGRTSKNYVRFWGKRGDRRNFFEFSAIVETQRRVAIGFLSGDAPDVLLYP